MFRCIIKRLKCTKINNRTFSSNSNNNKSYEPFYRFISNHDGLMATIEAQKLDDPHIEYPYYYMPDKTKQVEMIRYIAQNGDECVLHIIFFGSLRWFVASMIASYITFTTMDENSQNGKRIIKSALVGYTSIGTYVVYSIIGPIPVLYLYGGAVIAPIIWNTTRKATEK